MSEIIRLLILLACSPIVGFGTLLIGPVFPLMIVALIIIYIAIDSRRQA